MTDVGVDKDINTNSVSCDTNKTNTSILNATDPMSHNIEWLYNRVDKITFYSSIKSSSVATGTTKDDDNTGTNENNIDSNNNNSNVYTLPDFSDSSLESDEKIVRDFTNLPLISICICMKNAEQFLDETLFSCVVQTYRGPLEISIFDDSSTDKSIDIIKKWIPVFKHYSVCLVVNPPICIDQACNTPSSIFTHGMQEYDAILKQVNNGLDKEPFHKIDISGGPGFARNKAIRYSHGEYLCVCDADDVMYRDRVEMQYRECVKDHNGLVGSNFVRVPLGSSARYTDWCNRMTEQQVFLHQYREVSVIQPTWFMHRSVFDRQGGYVEAVVELGDGGAADNVLHNPAYYIMGTNDNAAQYKHKNQDKHIQKYKKLKSGPAAAPTKTHTAIPEDLIFFHRHIEHGGTLHKVGPAPLLVYRYHANNISNLIHRHMLMKVRIEYLEKRVLSQWPKFSIWGAGKDGKKFFTLLSDTSKAKVESFCDVDEKKIGHNYNAAYTPYSVPIIHFKNVKPPLIICVALDRSNNEFENNLASLNLEEGKDYWHFN
ncbi:hypothetical protein CYY_006823 [Polysphondylium violaceum]|uniref:Glycosyltransferase 2-like domain-containing protein n=1 Tax=Polysphondylium violaceum TaxID=133409 RepID=A0A8J4PRN9_9MYCE|nr:hypothetical protein CYY_006823 [Polysphondylium violaceum]